MRFLSHAMERIARQTYRLHYFIVVKIGIFSAYAGHTTTVQNWGNLKMGLQLMSVPRNRVLMHRHAQILGREVWDSSDSFVTCFFEVYNVKVFYGSIAFNVSSTLIISQFSTEIARNFSEVTKKLKGLVFKKHCKKLRKVPLHRHELTFISDLKDTESLSKNPVVSTMSHCCFW